jgi:predicted adenine nucleotide alpha hydrolase (AANH) superfamily ATPase
LHSCCGPCSSYCLKALSEHFLVTLHWFNPNIYPLEEYQKRLDTQRQLLRKMQTKNPVELLCDEYLTDEFYLAVKGLENEREGGARCEKCFIQRLEKTAQMAKEQGFDFFTTTLTVSPHKNATLINQIGQELAEKYDVKFLPSDFKKKNGYLQSIELSQKYELYRQNYCGCVYSLNLDKQ